MQWSKQKVIPSYLASCLLQQTRDSGLTPKLLWPIAGMEGDLLRYSYALLIFMVGVRTSGGTNPALVHMPSENDSCRESMMAKTVIW